jgi:Tfp pilus assembly protein PilZ
MVAVNARDGHLGDKDARSCNRQQFKKNLPTVACKTSSRAFLALVSDISTSGAFVKTGRCFSVGQEVAMTIAFPASGEMRTVTGEIVRLTSRGIGVKFNIFLKTSRISFCGLEFRVLCRGSKHFKFFKIADSCACLA